MRLKYEKEKREKGTEQNTSHFQALRQLETFTQWVSEYVTLYFSESEHCRGVVDTCVLSDNWSEGRGDTA